MDRKQPYPKLTGALPVLLLEKRLERQLIIPKRHVCNRHHAEKTYSPHPANRPCSRRNRVGSRFASSVQTMSIIVSNEGHFYKILQALLFFFLTIMGAADPLPPRCPPLMPAEEELAPAVIGLPSLSATTVSMAVSKISWTPVISLLLHSI